MAAMCMKIFSWGANNHGQLGQSHENDVLKPQIVKSDLNIKQISGGGAHTFVITENGELWSCGWNIVGQLGLEHAQKCSEFQPVKLNDDHIVKAIGGWDFSLAISKKGCLFVWGNNAFGQLGMENIGRKSDSCIEHPLNDVVDIAAGMRHSVLLKGNGDVYTCGSGKKGQLGLDSNKVPSAKQTVQKVTFQEQKGKIIQVAGGSEFSCALSDAGEILAWGSNKYGQLGLDPQNVSKIDTPVLIDTKFSESKIISIYCGWSHTITINEIGQIFTWGRADYGQLGRVKDGIPYDYNPAMIPDLLVQQFHCGSEHNLAVTKKGDLVSWGWNEHGICGTGDELNVFKPTVINIEQLNVELVGGGAGQSFAICNG